MKNILNKINELAQSLTALLLMKPKTSKGWKRNSDWSLTTTQIILKVIHLLMEKQN